MESKDRKFLPPFAELVDRLTIDQIKEVLIPNDKESFAKEMEDISHDIDLLIKEKGIELSARFIRIIVAISQINLHIWLNKDEMQKNEDKYDELLKFSHQLNGVKNQLKNLLLEEVGDKEKALQRSNFNTDGLEGWDISIK